MIKPFIVAALMILSSLGLALAGTRPVEFSSLSLNASALKASGEIKVPVPISPVKDTKAPEYRLIRMCSYMFAYGQGGGNAMGVFAFDVGNNGKLCEIPTAHGQVYGSYSCRDNGNMTAPTTEGGMALLFRNLREDGSSLYHQLNVPADFAAQNKFRGRMLISGKPPADLAKPLEHNGGGVYQLSCKMERVAFGQD